MAESDCQDLFCPIDRPAASGFALTVFDHVPASAFDHHRPTLDTQFCAEQTKELFVCSASCGIRTSFDTIYPAVMLSKTFEV